jgi:hypothetical protein
MDNEEVKLVVVLCVLAMLAYSILFATVVMGVVWLLKQ